VNTEAIGIMLDNHYANLAASVKPIVLSAGDTQRYTPALHQMHSELRKATKEVTDALGLMSTDDKESRTISFMTDLVASMAQAQGSIEIVQSGTMTVAALEVEIKSLVEGQKGQLDGFVENMEKTMKEMKEGNETAQKDHLAELDKLLKDMETKSDEKLAPLQASADALARVPELGDSILEAVKQLGEQLNTKLDGVDAKLVEGAKVADVHSEALQAVLKAAEAVGQQVQTALTLNDGTLATMEIIMDRGVKAISEKMVEIQMHTENRERQNDAKMQSVVAATTVVQTALMDVDSMVRRMETQMRSDAPMMQTMHDRIQSVKEEQRRLMQMFVFLKKRIERGDPLHLSTQMDEIRDDVNMMMRTLGMKIHAAPLQKFKETMRQMRQSGALGIQEGITRADVDSLLSKYANKEGQIDSEGVHELLADMTQNNYLPRAADHLHWNVEVNPDVRASQHPRPQKPKNLKAIPHMNNRPLSAPSQRYPSAPPPRPVGPGGEKLPSSPYHAEPFNVHNMPASGSLLNPVQPGNSSYTPGPAWRDPDVHLQMSAREKEEREKAEMARAAQRERDDAGIIDEDVLYGSLVPDSDFDSPSKTNGY